ncbi:MAG: hypothetical protein ACK5N9_01100 [Pirellula sp.]|jgi:hypothetical protein
MKKSMDQEIDRTRSADVSIKEKLATGVQLNGHSYRTYIDGYNLVDYPCVAVSFNLVKIQKQNPSTFLGAALYFTGHRLPLYPNML